MPTKTGAPSQHAQSSRKGKRAWRKNVNIGEIESGLEVLRQEERITGGHVHSRTNEELFQVDTRGDDHVRKKLPKLNRMSLTSYKILSQRSSVPAVKSNKKTSISYQEKKRMLTAGRRLKNGLLDVESIQATPNRVSIGQYDMWGDLKEVSQGSGVKMPGTVNPHRKVALPPVPPPHAGTSYNPTVTAHQELLLKAHEIEEKKQKENMKYDGVKQTMHRAEEEQEEGIASGMTLDTNEDPEDEHGEVTEEGEASVVKPSRPKTKKQRRKAALLLRERRERAARVARKKQLEEITSSTLKSLKQSIVHADEAAAAKARQEEEFKKGLAGKKLGKHVVPEERIDVQLGEELSESFRALQPEGSVLRDRFQSLQQRALIEPRSRVLPKQRRLRIKDYEKHPWKRFE